VIPSAVIKRELYVCHVDGSGTQAIITQLLNFNNGTVSVWQFHQGKLYRFYSSLYWLLVIRRDSGGKGELSRYFTLTSKFPGNSIMGKILFWHFGRDDIEFPWEKTDKAAVLKKAAGL
jgi:hypothetical protein